MRQLKRVKANGVKVKDTRKIKSKKTIVDGIEFDSLLEAKTYKALKETGIEFERQKEYEILPPFQYGNEKMRKMVWTPDFYIPCLNLILESKGLPNESFPLRLKIFKFVNKENPPVIVLVKNQKEIDLFVEQYLTKHYLP